MQNDPLCEKQDAPLSNSGDLIADAVTNMVGSWRFIIIQSVILFTWLILNSFASIFHWDPYPFILLNLVLSFQAAYSAPFVMMSQNRQAAKDRLTVNTDLSLDAETRAQVLILMHTIQEQGDRLIALEAMLDERLPQKRKKASATDAHLATV